jgi:hypothetical protein
VFNLGTGWFVISYLHRVDPFVTRIVPLTFLYDCGVVQFDDVVGDVRGPFGAHHDKERQNHDNGYSYNYVCSDSGKPYKHPQTRNNGVFR